MMTHPQPPQPSPELTDWQAARYGDSDATRAALAFYREREWKVDERYGKHDDLEARISAFKAGFDTARQQVEAQHAEEVKALRSNLAAVEQITDAEVADFRAQLATLQQTLTAREQDYDTVSRERAESFERLSKAVGGVFCTPWQAEVDLEIEGRIGALKAERDTLASALKVLKHGLGAKCQESGDFHQARKWLNDRDIYEGNLTGERVLLEVAKVALREITRLKGETTHG